MDLGRHWRAAATALALATFLAGRQIASWGTPRNRWDYFWQRQDAVALIVAVLLLALAVYAVGMALSRWQWSRKRRLHELGLVLSLIAALLSQFPALNKNPSVLRATLLWAGVAVVVWFAWKRWSVKLAAFARGACLVMLPLVPILFGQMLLWKPWDVAELSTTAAPAPENGTRRPLVVMVILDEWSWFRVAPGGEPAPEYPNLRHLAERSVLVREARSAGPETRLSVPRLLFQASGDLVPGNGVAKWKDSSGSRPTEQVPSLFDDLGRLGYRSSVVGFYLNYRGLIGPDRPDRICCKANVYRGPTWISNLGLMLGRNLQHWTDPVSQAIWPGYSAGVYSRSWVRLVQALRVSAAEQLATEPDNTFLLIHLPLPHPPFIFDSAGTYLGAYQGERKSEDIQGYQRNLRFADKLLGEILTTLDSAGRLDRSLLIVTSDHAWRMDPDSSLSAQPDAVLRVPLLVKWPGQERPIVSDERFCQLGLWPVLEAAPHSPAPPAMTDSLWQAISATGRQKTCTR